MLAGLVLASFLVRPETAASKPAGPLASVAPEPARAELMARGAARAPRDIDRGQATTAPSPSDDLVIAVADPIAEPPVAQDPEPEQVQQPEPSPAQAPLKLQLVPDINTNFHFRSQPNSLAQYTHRGIPAHFFLWLGPVSATRFAFLTTPVFPFWLSLYYARLQRPNRRARHLMFMSSIRPKGARLFPSFV